jgi:hypothetical protein
MAAAKIVPPDGTVPLFIRGNTCEKFGLKTGPNVLDLVDYINIPKADLMKEIQVGGQMSDFFPAKKEIESCPKDTILITVDKSDNPEYGERFLICYTAASQDSFTQKMKEMEEALEAQRQAEVAAEEARVKAAWERANVVYEDKPLDARPWISQFPTEVEQEMRLLVPAHSREIISLEVSMLKKNMKRRYVFNDRVLENQAPIEFKAVRDPNFVRIRESDSGFQVAPTCKENSAQTTWNKPVNKSVQYESASVGTDDSIGGNDDLLGFLERVTVRIENALQQNESVDIFHETFEMPKHGDDEVVEDTAADSELREVKNFGDPMYTKGTAIVAIDWMPKVHGLVAVSQVKSSSFDERIAVSGQTSTAYVLLWDFKQLVKPQVLMQCQYEIFAFKFNPKISGLVAGGTITGQVVLWDITDALMGAVRRTNRGQQVGALSLGSAEEDDESASGPVMPKYVSGVDHSHKRCVSELYWLPPNTQINYRGQLVSQEHLDGNSYQFVTVAGDGLVLVWDIRFEQIAQDELRHVGRAKHIITEKATRDGQPKAIWSPIFRAHLKRLEGVGELSLCKVNCPGNLPSKVSAKSSLAGDFRSHVMIGTEEGDIIFADLSARKAEASGTKGEEEEENEAEGGREFVRWIATDHARPAVGFQLSPFFSDIILSVSDWGFNIWRVSDVLFTLCLYKLNSYCLTDWGRKAFVFLTVVQDISDRRMLVSNSSCRRTCRHL